MKCFYLLPFFLFPILVKAQQIAGVVKDSSNTGIAKATVSVHSVNDSSVLKYGITDSMGKFTIELSKRGKVFVNVKATRN